MAKRIAVEIKSVLHDRATMKEPFRMRHGVPAQISVLGQELSSLFASEQE